MLYSVELLNVMDFGKVAENELSFLFTMRTLMVQVLPLKKRVVRDGLKCFDFQGSLIAVVFMTDGSENAIAS